MVRELGLGGYTTAAALAERYGGGPNPGADSIPELRTFGHVLVDEAQDLTPMQWRMLARRCPNGSMTIVGDFGQASRPGAAKSWDEVLEHLPTHDTPRRVNLTVNYRTPAEIMDLANRLLTVAASGVEPTQAVRRTGFPPQFTRVTDLVAGAADAARVAKRRRRHRRGDRADRAARGRSPRRSRTSVRSPTRPRRSTRRSGCCSPPTRRVWSSTMSSWWNRPGS